MKFKSLFGSLVLLATIAMSTQSLTAYGTDSYGGEYGNYGDNFGGGNYGGGYGGDCCPPPCEPCGGNWDCCDGTPYDACKWSASINGGVTPMWFQRRGRTLQFDRLGGLFFEPFGHKLPKFNDLFDLPWNVGIELGYMLCDRVETFVDFDYTSAKGKNRSYVGPDEIFVRHRFNHYRAYDFYLGTRYYLPTWFCSFTPFFGAKVGLVARNKIRTHTTRSTVDGVEISSGSFTRFKSDTTISGGLQMGVNWDFSACASVTLKAEAVWSGDWRPSVIDESVSPLSTFVPLVVYGKTGPVLSVPVTLGLRYAF